MGIERVRQLWRDEKPVRAAWMLTADNIICETMAHAGFDLLVFDMQHGMGVGVDRALACLEALGNGDVAVLVRVPWNDPTYMQYVLDAGADGVIVPLVNSAADAALAAGACRYPPLGFRSFGPSRARFRAGASDYITWANEQVVCLAMIEHRDAVKNLEEIAKTPGLDGFMVGPVDLGLSMGLRPGEKNAELTTALAKVPEVARAAGKVSGNYAGGGPREAMAYMSEGHNLCPIASDLVLIRTGVATALTEFEELTKAADARAGDGKSGSKRGSGLYG